eukprot:TRINITY_DN18621_c0_g1_i1.p1 TRINITY_DN18621_c0_g1~~TRINITY_DN18621_c0_g1_i1.p1  ORF type:complete len:287 (+),score=52.04 TRINITY_DN18621_c0_g1_i1:282-1142(+)
MVAVQATFEACEWSGSLGTPKARVLRPASAAKMIAAWLHRELVCNSGGAIDTSSVRRPAAIVEAVDFLRVGDLVDTQQPHLGFAEILLERYFLRPAQSALADVFAQTSSYALSGSSDLARQLVPGRSGPLERQFGLGVQGTCAVLDNLRVSGASNDAASATTARLQLSHFLALSAGPAIAGMCDSSRPSSSMCSLTTKMPTATAAVSTMRVPRATHLAAWLVYSLQGSLRKSASAAASSALHGALATRPRPSSKCSAPRGASQKTGWRFALSCQGEVVRYGGAERT